MPIYDNNGTTSLEIGKLYDNNGTTNSPIKYVYDNNGSTNSLIYQDREYLIGSEGNDTVQLSYNNSNSYGDTWSKYAFKINNITSFNATGFTKIYFDAIMEWWAYKNPGDSNLRVHAMALFGLKSNNSTSTIGVYSQTDLNNKVLGNAWLTGWQWAGAKGNEWSWDGEINNGSQDASTKVRQQFSLDISSLSGTQYLYFGGSVNGGGIYNNASVYNIWLE